jgi:hypothetical protein
MTRSPSFDLVRDLLDHELIDVEGVSCGMADDVEIRVDGRECVVVALICGPDAWVPRLPAALRMLARLVGARGHARVPFAEVERLSESIHLKSRATELGLGIVDRRVGRWLARIVRAS